MYQNKTSKKLQQLAMLGFEEEIMDDFYQIFMDAECEALGLNEFSQAYFLPVETYNLNNITANRLYELF